MIVVPKISQINVRHEGDRVQLILNGKLFAFGYMAGIMRALKLPYS